MARWADLPIRPDAIDTSTKYVDKNAFHRHIVFACHFIHAHIGHAHTLLG
jgi:hypothetical protein